MIEKMDSLKRTVLELLLGIAFWTVVFELGGLAFVKSKMSYSVGLLCGVVIAVGMTLHMAHNLNNALNWEPEIAKREVKKGAFIRYLAVVAITILLAWLKIGDILSCFLGIMTLKTAAYAQPYVHKLLNKIYHIEEGGCENAIITDDDEFDFGEWAEHGFHDSWFNRF